jgi:hypothetical protein
MYVRLDADTGYCRQELLSLVNFSLLVWTGLGLLSPTSRAIKLRELTMSNALRDIGECASTCSGRRG